MPIFKKNINSYPDVLGYFQKYYKDSLKTLEEVPILEISDDLWKKFHLVGYGYVVRAKDLLPNQRYLEMASNNTQYYDSLPTLEHKRDVNVYRMWKKINVDIFLVVRHSLYASYFIVHELSHLIGAQNEFEKMNFNDEYLDLPEEQFAHLNEFRYAQENGYSFDEYFKNTFPDAYRSIKLFEKGDRSISFEEYQLSKMDERDYLRMWEYVKKMNKTSKNSNGFIKIAQTLSKEKVHGKFGDFTAYIISGNTLPIMNKLKELGFRWYSAKQSWWISESKFTPYIKNELSKIGIGDVHSQPTAGPITEPIAQPIIQTPSLKDTENPEASKWYGFPINHNIMEYDLDFELNGEKHTEHVIIDRLYQVGKGSDSYREIKSREHKGLPKYVVRIGSKTENGKTVPLGKMTFISKNKWGTYNEQDFLNEVKDYIKKKLENNPPQKYVANAHNEIKWHYDFEKRTPEFKQFLNDISDKKISPEYTLHINDPVYGGNYPVSVNTFSGEDAQDVYVDTALKDPHAPRHTMIDHVNLFGVHTVEEFNKKINDSLTIDTDERQNRYIKYLKSFPFLPEQKKESFADFGEIMRFVSDPSSNADAVFAKIKEKGYIRPSKKQKFDVGLTSGEEIKWIVDSKKIVNDAYSFGNSPDYFYAVVSYYVHRKIRGIWSWTDMMLMDTMSVWVDVMKKYGANLTFKDVEKSIETIGDFIISKIYSGKTKEQRNKEFRDWFEGEGREKDKSGPVGSAMSNFANFAQQYGIDPDGIADNVKKIYRTLVNQLHPDKYQDPKQKEEMTKKFQELQSIWDAMPDTYKTAFSWYCKYVFGEK